MTMNPFALIIIVALLVEFVLGVVATLLNLKALKLEPPPTLESVYKPDEYRRSQEYTRTNTRFEFVTSTFRLVLLLSFWFAGGFNYLDQVVRAWGYGNIVNGLLYIGILWISYDLLMLPFSVYDTFVIEQRFGFNRTTPSMFLIDRVKGLTLAVFIGAPLLAGMLALLEYLGPYAWLYCWVVVTMFVMAMQFVAPLWIMPLFNKFTPMKHGELKDAIRKYVRVER